MMSLRVLIAIAVTAIVLIASHVEGFISSKSTPLTTTTVTPASFRHRHNHNYHHYGRLNHPLSATESSNNNNNKNHNNNDFEDEDSDLQMQLKEGLEEIQTCLKWTFETFAIQKNVQPTDIVQVCDQLDELESELNLQSTTLSTSSTKFSLRRWTLERRRYEWLGRLLQSDYEAYIATASFLSPTRIPRRKLPNVQDVPLAKGIPVGSKQFQSPTHNKNSDDKNKYQKDDDDDDDDQPSQLEPPQLVIEDCKLDDLQYQDNLLDVLLLKIFRNLVTQNTGGVTSPQSGILGLVEQGRTFMLQPGQTPEAQHKMVRDTLAGLMTPVLPPFYRIFMSGIIPNINNDNDDNTERKLLGPWFYAPLLTSIVTPTFFGFLVGPSYPNRRKDGQLGGLVVEKCKFLQESGCKGLCLNQCKLPAQQFFQDELGLPLTVSPNFVTQECQWSFGEVPLPVAQDPSFPQGCLVGCESRQQIQRSGGSNADICN